MSIKLHHLLPCLLFLITLTGLQGRPELDYYRQWQSKDGQSVLGRLKKIEQGHVIIDVYGSGMVQIPFRKLAPQEFVFLNRYLRAINKEELEIPNISVGATARQQIPSTNQSQFGRSGRNNTCGPNACVNFLLWWADLGMIQLEEDDDRNKQCDSLHSDLARWMSSGRGTNIRELQEGLEKYFDKHPPKYYTPEFRIEPFSIETAVEHTKGSKMVVLSLQVLDNNRPEDGHWVSLVDCQPDGRISINTWGRRFYGYVVPGVHKGQPVYRIELIQDPGNNLNNWYSEEGGGFMIEATDQIFIGELVPKT